MKIYIDLLIFQDTFINFLILFLLTKILNIRVKTLRIIIVSFLSSIFSALILILYPFLFDNLFVKIILSLLMVKFTLNVKLKELLIPKTILMWCISFLFGGIGLISNGNLIVFFLLIILSCICILKYKTENKHKLLLDSAICFIEFEYDNKVYKFKSLMDTGNNVSTFLGEDVIFVRDKLFKCKGGDKNSRVVSYQTVSGKQKKKGTKIYNIKISYGEKRICNNAVIVSTPNILNDYDAIVGYHLIEGGWANGNNDFTETKSQKIIY